MRWLRRLIGWGAVGLLAVALILGVLAITTPSGQRSVDALSALFGLYAHVTGQGETGPSSLETGAVQRLAHTYIGRHGAWEADRYLPRDGGRAGLVIVPGAAPDGRNDPRLIAFALLFADAGFEVLIPEIGNLRRMRLGTDDIDAIADAMVQLSELRRAEGSAAEPQPIGAVAISYAVGPTVIALTRPELRDRVGLIVGIGGYYDIANVVTFFTTEHIRDGDGWRRGSANRYGRWVFADANADRLRDRRDQILLAEIARLRWSNQDAPVDDLIERLGPEGRAVMALLENRDPDAVTRLMAALPASIRQELDGLDPSQVDLSSIAARGLLVHGRGDRIIPFTESEALAAAWPPDRIDLYVLDAFGHVDGSALPIAALWGMFQAVRAVMAFRDQPSISGP